MIRTSAMLSCVSAPALLAALLLGSAPAAAQSAAILGKDDAEFARQLYKQGWADLAEGVVHAYEKLDKAGGADPIDLLEVQSVGLDLRLDLARREPDPAQRRQAIAEVIAAKQKLVDEHPRTQVGRETRDNLPDAYRLLGEAVNAALARENDPAKLATLRAEGEAAFARAEKDLQERLDTLRDARFDESQPNADVQYMNALFNLGRTRYFHSRFYPPGDAKRDELLSQAVSTFEEFGLEYGERLLNFESIFMIGLCHRAQGKHAEALDDWVYVGTLREGFEPDAQGRYEVTPEVAELISKSALQRVLLLSELGRTAEAIAVADDFWDKLVDPESAGSGLAVLAAKAEAQLAVNDATAAGETARRLIDLDPLGPWGNKGREVQGKLIGGSGGASIGAGEILRVAQNLFGQGRAEQALDALQHVLIAAQGDAKEQDYGSQALFLMGQIYRQKNWIHEASLVFDVAYERYPKGEAAGDALAAAMDCYSKLNAKEKRPFYKARVQERGQTLARQFPNHLAAASQQQTEAKELKDEGKYVEAAQLFRGVPAGAAGYPEAQVQAGNCLFLQGRVLTREKKENEAKALFAEAETVTTKALAEVASAKAKTLDQQVIIRLSSAEFTGLTTLAQIYLEDAVGKPQAAYDAFQGADEKYAADAKALEAVWQLRIRALEKLGRVDEAVAQFDALLGRQSDNSGLAGAAGVLAYSLDVRADGAYKAAKQAQPADAAKLEQALQGWRKAVRYYVLKVGPAFENRAAAKAGELEPIAKRLLDIGMVFNGLPDHATSFAGWYAPKAVETATWEQAAKLYELVVELDPANYRARIGHARALGFLRNWKDAAAAYTLLFEQERLLKADKSGIDAAVNSSKPELLEAYLEWGIADAEAGAAEKSADRQTRALAVFDLLSASTTQLSELWWIAKYRQARTLFDRGMYEPADVAIRGLERATSKDFSNAPADLRPVLVSLRTDISKKIPPR